MTSMTNTSYYMAGALDGSFYLQVCKNNNNVMTVQIKFTGESCTDPIKIGHRDHLIMRMLCINFQSEGYKAKGFLFTLKEIKEMKAFLDGDNNSASQKIKMKALALRSFIKENIKPAEGYMSLIYLREAVQVTKEELDELLI